MDHTFKDLKKQNSLQAVYLLLGNEDFLQKKSLEWIRQKVIHNPEYKDFNLDIFDASSTPVRKLIESSETLPIFLEKRLVVCHNAHLFKETDIRTLASYLKTPPSTSVIVLLAPELDKRKKTSKHILELCFVVKNSNPKQKELEKWVQYLAQCQNLQISDTATKRLIQWAGPSLSSIDNEIKKIKSFVGNRTQITDEDIFQIVSRVRPENIFSFTEAIGKKDLEKSFQLLIHLLEDQESEVGLVALLSRHIRILSQIKECLQQNLSPSEISFQTGIPSFFIKDYVHQVKLWNQRGIANLTKILYDTEKALKSSPLSSDIWLENFVLKACSL